MTKYPGYSTKQLGDFPSSQTGANSSVFADNQKLDIKFIENQMIISKNPQFTGISARQQLEFTTHLLLTD